jgi:hypothetical protein
MIMDNVHYDIRWSDRLDERFIDDYIALQNEIFNVGSRDEFDRQFINNIYGRSVLVVVYADGEPIAARALWRNDINGNEAYQPGSTCVINKYRGRGIFMEMTRKAIAELPEGVIIYNFPNTNSFPGYMKMGWRVAGSYKARLYLSYKEYAGEHPSPIDDQYVKWWLSGKALFHKKIASHYFILQKDVRPFCYHILGEVSMRSAKMFPEVNMGLVFYKSQKVTCYNKRLGSTNVVCRNTDVSDIPTWKIDAVV